MNDESNSGIYVLFRELTDYCLYMRIGVYVCEGEHYVSVNAKYSLFVYNTISNHMLQK